MQLGLGRKGAVLGLRDTWTAVIGGKMGYRVRLVGVGPRVSPRTCVKRYEKTAFYGLLWSPVWACAASPIARASAFA